MAKFTINFTANTIGKHFVGWRTYNDIALPFHNVEVVDVLAPGAHGADIEIDGNVYCAHSDIEYTGYIVAACELQDPDTLENTGIPDPSDDTNANGIPDGAFTWAETILEQTDPCIETDILCESVAIDSLIVVDDGTSGCSSGTFPLTFTEVSPGDEIIAATGTVTYLGGVVSSTNITAGGQYKVPPVVTALGVSCNSTPVFTAVMVASCPPLDLTPYDCASQNDLTDTPIYTINYGETVTICADDSTLGGLSDQFLATAVGNCHCQDCAGVTIDASGSASGSGKVSYQTCWDGSNLLGEVTLVTQVVDFGSITQLGCIIPDTIAIDQGTLDVDFIVTSGPC